MAATTGMHRPLRRTLAAAAVAAGLLLAGCGGDGAEPAAPATAPADAGAEGGAGGEATPIALAAATTLEAGTARIATTSNTEVQGIGTEFTGEGVFDFGSQRGTMEVSIGGQPPTQTVTDAGVTYTQLPQEMAAALPGKSWLRVETGTAQPGTPGTAGPGPDALLTALEASSTGLTEVGEEQVRGGDTATHYSATLDLADHPSGQDLIPLLGESLPVEVWVDAEGRLRKMITETTLSAAGSEVSSSTTVELWDFGAPVEVTVPPADQVATMDEFTAALQEQLEGALTG